MKRFLLPITLSVAVAVASTSVISIPQPAIAASSELEKVNKELARIKKEMQQAQALEKKAKKEIERIRGQKNAYSAEVDRLDEEIAVTSSKLNNLDEQINEVETNLDYTVQELHDAEERIEVRDGLLKSRLRLMYVNGFVGYTDVLLSSTSFTDFLDRLNALQSIISQDKEILISHMEDKQLVEQKKVDIEAQLQYVEQLFAETSKLQEQLTTKRQNRQVAITSLEAEENHFEELTEEQEKDLMKLADEQAKLTKKKKELQGSGTKKVTKYTGGQLKWPVPDSDRITSMFGTRTHPITKKKHTHSGLDIGAPAGTKIVAAASGEVVLAQWYGGYGNCVIIEHKDGFRTLYAHIRTGGIKVKVGDIVEAGDKIAEVGSTGNSTGNHLHFGVYVNNQATDPLPYLQ